MQDQSKEAINWAITAFLGYLADMILMMILIGLLVILAVGITHIVVCILGALNASKGTRYRAPFAVRLLK